MRGGAWRRSRALTSNGLLWSGKSAALVLPGADLHAAVKATLGACFLNSGQTCSAPTRLLVPRGLLVDAEHLITGLLEGYKMGDPADPTTRLGPLVSSAQRQRVKSFIDAALAEGAQYFTNSAVKLPETLAPASRFDR